MTEPSVRAVAIPVRFLVPMAHVQSVPASIAFYGVSASV